MTVPSHLAANMHGEAGSVLVSELETHWDVSAPTARKIIAEASLKAVGSGWERYFWRDIWRLEGEIFVPQHNWSSYREPLLKTSALPERDPKGRSKRTLRRYVEKGQIPSIRLSDGVVRVRANVYDIAIHHV